MRRSDGAVARTRRLFGRCATLARLLVVAATVAAAGAAACGGGGHHRPGIVGTYTIDVAATFGLSASPGASEAPTTSGVRARFDASACSLVLAGDLAFRMETATGGSPLVVVGTWAREGDVVRLAATAIDGGAPTAEETAPDALRVEGDALVLEAPGGRRVVWRRSP